MSNLLEKLAAAGENLPPSHGVHIGDVQGVLAALVHHIEDATEGKHGPFLQAAEEGAEELLTYLNRQAEQANAQYRLDNPDAQHGAAAVDPRVDALLARIAQLEAAQKAATTDSPGGNGQGQTPPPASPGPMAASQPTPPAAPVETGMPPEPASPVDDNPEVPE